VRLIEVQEGEKIKKVGKLLFKEEMVKKKEAICHFPFSFTLSLIV